MRGPLQLSAASSFALSALSVLAAILAVVTTIALAIVGIIAFGLGWIFNWIARAAQRGLDAIWTPRHLT
jgi:hypothetical protein